MNQLHKMILVSDDVLVKKDLTSQLCEGGESMRLFSGLKGLLEDVPKETSKGPPRNPRGHGSRER